MTFATRGQIRETAKPNRRDGKAELVHEIQVLFDSSELAHLLGTTDRHIKRLVAERRIPFVKVGRFARVEAHAVAEWLSEMTVHKEHVRLRRWAHADRLAGHVATKCRRWSTTMTALRQARHEWRVAQEPVIEETAGTTIWVCEGVGHRFEIDHSLATTYAEVQRKGREQAWFARTTLGWSVS